MGSARYHWVGSLQKTVSNYKARSHWQATRFVLLIVNYTYCRFPALLPHTLDTDGLFQHHQGASGGNFIGLANLPPSDKDTKDSKP